MQEMLPRMVYIQITRGARLSWSPSWWCWNSWLSSDFIIVGFTG